MYQSRIANSKKRTNRETKNRHLEEPEDGQCYAIVQDLLGNGRLRALCSDNQIRLAKIRGSLRKSSHKIIIEKNDLILVSMRDFEDKVDVLHKYTYEEANYIIQTFEVPACIERAWNMTDKYNTETKDDNNIIFAEENNKYTRDGKDKASMYPSDSEDERDTDTIIKNM
jgi:initiation factor 1A